MSNQCSVTSGRLITWVAWLAALAALLCLAQPAQAAVRSDDAAFDASFPEKYYRGSGVDIPFTVQGPLPEGSFVRVRVWHNDQGKMVKDFRHDLHDGPWKIDASKLDLIPPGGTRLFLYLFRPDRDQPTYSSRWLEVRDGSSPGTITDNAATRADFTSAYPGEYVLGSGKDIAFELDGEMPDDGYVRVRVWHNDQGKMIKSFRHDLHDGPWKVDASKLDRIPPGGARLFLYLFKPGQSKPTYSSRWLVVRGTAPDLPSDEPPIVDQGGGDDGNTDDGSTNDDSDGQVADGNDDTNNDDTNTGGDGSDGQVADGGDDTDTGNDDNTGGDDSDGQVADGSDDTGSGSGDEWTGSDQVTHTPSSFLGMNLEPAHYWSRSWMYTDVMDQASWHNGVFRAYVDTQGHFPHGNYKVVPANAARVETFPGKAWDQIKIIPNPGFEHGNFQVFLPGFGPGESGYGQKFHPLFLDRVRPFKVLRYMVLQRTGNNEADRWNQRPLPFPNRTKREGDRGGAEVPVEHLVELCNELDADPWFCMPHLADENYVRQFARLVKAKLHPDATIYVEFSNELWNWNFQQSKWVRDSVGNANPINHARWAERIKWVRTLWRQEFGNQADRVVMVLAVQEANPWHAETLIPYLTENGQRHFDAISTSAYFGNQVGTINEGLVNLRGKQDERDRHGQLSRKYGVPYIAYEAGHHLLPKNGAIMSEQETQAMYDAIQENMLSFEKAGGSMYGTFAFISPKNEAGYWGHMEYQDQSLQSAYKYRAVVDYLNSNRRLQLTSFD